MVGVREDNKNAYNVDLLRQVKVRRITLQRDGKATVFKVPLTGSFPLKNSKAGDGVSAEEVTAEVSAQYMQKHPRKLLERAEAFMREWVGVTLDAALHAKVSTHRALLAAWQAVRQLVL